MAITETTPGHVASQSVSVEAARNLSTTTKSHVHQLGVTPRYLLNLLSWVGVEAGSYRVNRRRVIIPEALRLRMIGNNGTSSVAPDSLGDIPFLSGLDPSVLQAIASRLTSKTYNPGDALPSGQFLVIASGQVEVRSQGAHGENIRTGMLSGGQFLGSAALYGGTTPDVAATAKTATTVLSLSTADVDSLAKQSPDMAARINQRISEMAASGANEWGESPIDMSSGHFGEVDLPKTFVDYELIPKQYTLEAIQTILRVHTRITDIYNSPIDQLREQMGLTISAMRERQEWELINHPGVGLLSAAAPSMRIPTRSGPPTPDDMDDLLSLVWKQPAFFLAHPRAIAAFGRECTRRGVPPMTVNLFGTPFITWRGVPIVPSDKLAVDGRCRTDSASGQTSILLMRVGETEGGVVGLNQAGIPDEIEGVPSLSARFMGINDKSVASYLLSLYFSVAVLTDDALGVLEGVEVGRYHDYE